MYGIFYICPVSVGLDSQIWYLFIYITGYLNVRKISETMHFRTFVGPLEVYIFRDGDWEKTGTPIFLTRLHCFGFQILR